MFHRDPNTPLEVEHGWSEDAATGNVNPEVYYFKWKATLQSAVLLLIDFNDNTSNKFNKRLKFWKKNLPIYLETLIDSSNWRRKVEIQFR